MKRIKELSKMRRAIKTVCKFSSVRIIIDATYSGNFTRVLNHSCAPTLELEAIRVDSYIPRLVFFTKRLIKKGEELTFHYGSNGNDFKRPEKEENRALEQHKCQCGSAVCQGSLPFDPSL
jgi:SET domain-containing protein